MPSLHNAPTLQDRTTAQGLQMVQMIDIDPQCFRGDILEYVLPLPYFQNAQKTYLILLERLQSAFSVSS